MKAEKWRNGRVKDPDQETVRVNFNLPIEDYEEVCAIAKHEGLAVAHLMRGMVNRLIGKYKR